MKIPIFVVHKKSPRKNAKLFLSRFDNILVDDILNPLKRKPPIPATDEIVKIGVGKKFGERYMKKYPQIKVLMQ